MLALCYNTFVPTDQPERTTNELPDNLNELFQRVFAVIRQIFGTTVGVIIIGAVLFILLIITSIILRV